MAPRRNIWRMMGGSSAITVNQSCCRGAWDERSRAQAPRHRLYFSLKYFQARLCVCLRYWPIVRRDSHPCYTLTSSVVMGGFISTTPILRRFVCFVYRGIGRVIEAHARAITALSWARGGRRLLSASHDQRLHYWALEPTRPELIRVICLGSPIMSALVRESDASLRQWPVVLPIYHLFRVGTIKYRYPVLMWPINSGHRVRPSCLIC